MPGPARRLLSAFGAVLLCAGLGASPAHAVTDTLSFTGASQTWTVPDYVTSVTFDLYGAQGGGAGGSLGGGGGGEAKLTMAVTPGQTFQVNVGGMGPSGRGHLGPGGWNGGGGSNPNDFGQASFGGGGATDVRSAGTTLASRILVAGGGGGGGDCSANGASSIGGAGGGLTGGEGSPGGCGGTATTGKGGTQTGGGDSGGTLGQGGTGDTTGGYYSGGGGGGGYYGGGGGLDHGRGGGGSGYGPLETVFSSGARGGDGVALISYTGKVLTITDSGTGGGYVDSSPAAADCGIHVTGHTTCTPDYHKGDVVTLTAHPSANSNFDGFSGSGCSGTATTCTVTMDDAKSVSATFTLKQRALTITPAGTGTGYVTTSLSGAHCDTAGTAACAASEPDGTQVTLTAHPDSSTTNFSGFSGGGCSGTATTCTVTMDADKTVIATFALQQRALTAARAGTGHGHITSSPAGINCGDDTTGTASCTTNGTYGSQITLTAVPADNTDFAGFSGGGCSGTATTCTVTMDDTKSVTGTFTLKQRELDVTPDGNGHGYVTSSPEGIDCAKSDSDHTACGTTYTDGTSVTLTAHPADDTAFTGFSGGGCSGSATTCKVSMTQARTVTATFTLLDSDPPVTTITPTDVTGGWAHGLSVTASDAVSGVAQTHCWVDPASAPTAFSDTGSTACPATLADGTHEVYAASTDKAGNAETPVHQTVKIDATAPSTSITPTDVTGGWAHGLTVTASDAGAGVGETRCWIDPASAPTAFSDSGSTACPTTLPDGTHDIYAASEDKAGNTEAPVHKTVQIDTTAPSSTITPTGVTSGWAHGLSVTASDDGSGVAETRCWVDPASAPTAFSDAGSTACPTTLADGTHEVYAASKDNAGNTETPAHKTVKIDTTAPTTGITPAGGWAQSVSVTASDAGSGVAETRCWVDPASAPTAFSDSGSTACPSTLSDGTHDVYAASKDNAANTETPVHQTVKIDTAAPTTTITPTGVTGDWAHGLSVTATDAGSGVGETRCWIDPASAPTAFSDSGSTACPTTLSDGTHEVYAASKDNAGNTEAPVHKTVKIDTTAPSSTITATGVSGGWAHGLSVTAADAGSGVAETRCWVDPASAPTAFSDSGSTTCPTTLPDGIHEVYAASKDNAGNTEAPVHQTFKIDTTKPVLTLPGPIAVDATTPKGTTVPYVATAADATSGPATSAATCTPASGSAFPIGDTTVSCSSADAAGNAASGTFAVHVRGAEEQLAALLAATRALGGGPGTSLALFVADAQSTSARACLDLALYRMATGMLEQLHFDTERLTAAAGRIRAVLACPAMPDLLVTPPAGSVVDLRPATASATLPPTIVAPLAAIVDHEAARITVSAAPAAASITLAATAPKTGGRTARATVVLRIKPAKKAARAKRRPAQKHRARKRGR